MIIGIKEITKSSHAVKRIDGQRLYDLLDNLINRNAITSITLDFEGINIITISFLNASIGKYLYDNLGGKIDCINIAPEIRRKVDIVLHNSLKYNRNKSDILTEQAEEISRFLNDFDNLQECNFFECEDEDFQDHVRGEHKSFTFNEFMGKAREYIRQLYVIKKQQAFQPEDLDSEFVDIVNNNFWDLI